MQQLDWLIARFYLFFEVSPISDASVKVYNFDKFGNPITKTARTYHGTTLEEAILSAYNSEQK